MRTRCGAGHAWLLLAIGGCVERGSVLDVAPSLSEEPPLLEPAAASSEVVSGSGVHTCAVSRGAAYCWGDNALGQVVSPSESDRVGPTVVPGDGWWSIVAGVGHTCSLDRHGEVYCWGDNALGQLGQGDRSSWSTRVAVSLPVAAVQLAGGFHHSCVVLDNSELWCWGENSEGQLGRGEAFPAEQAEEGSALLPQPVVLADGVRDGWAQVNTGEGHTCALRSNGSLWCWGRNSQRQLGVASVEGQVPQPVPVGGDTDWQAVDASLQHSCALKVDGSLWCWGYNMGIMSASGNPFGRLCADQPDCMQLDEPTQVAPQRRWAAFRTHVFHTCALDLDAQLWCWGRNHEGQLAMENPPDPQTPGMELQVHGPTLLAAGVTLFGLGRFTTCAGAAGAGLRCAGKNDRGQLGVGVGLSRFELVEVPLSEALPAQAP